MPSANEPPSSQPRSSQPCYRRYRAPREDNRALVEPSLVDSLRLSEANRQVIEANDADLHGWRLNAWAAAARQRLLSLATEYTRAFCDAPALAGDGSLFVSGHQPELFHPGVWFKNRVLDRLAERSGGVSVHLLIDSDQCTAASLRTPAGTVEAPHWEAVAYDQTIEARPYEERAIADAGMFASFAERVQAALAGLVEAPLVAEMWSDAVAAQRGGANLGEALSRGRRLIEQRWGAGTLELPLSRLCDTRELRWGMALVLADAPRVQEAYNGALAAYRAAHRLRTPAQPLPDLTRDGEGWETPLWVWTADDPTRRALFVTHSAKGWRLSDRRGGEWRVSTRPDQSLDDAVEQLAALREQGVKVRPRALVTTLLARLLLGDLFLHGIGGAKYDQVTDDFARRWLGFAPPPHATVTATLRLPIEHEPASEQQATRLRVRLRELEFHPERFSNAYSADAAPYLARKEIAIRSDALSLREKHREIVAANEALHPFVREQREATMAKLAGVRQRLRAASVLDSRECSLCLYPEADLRKRFDVLLEDC